MNYIGNRYGRLFALCSMGTYPNGHKKILCLCDCGNVKYVLDSSLTSGKTQSCGCIRKEIMSALGKSSCKNRKNNYSITNEIIFVELPSGESFTVDKKFQNLIDSSYWVLRNGYVHSTRHKKDLHRLLLDCPKGLCIDHINRNKLDNRMSNLRIATYSTNTQNSTRKTKSNGLPPGVWYSRKDNKYCAAIQYNKKRIWIGQFNCKEDAIAMRKQKEKELLFGDNNRAD